MRINVIGAGTMGSVKRGNQSVLIDDVLFDVGSGVVKKLEKLNRELEKSEKKLRKAINDEKALQHQLKQQYQHLAKYSLGQ